MPSPHELLRDPHWFLHRIDPAGGSVTFVPTVRDRLAAPSFIDGRSDFSTGSALDLPLDQLVAAAAELEEEGTDPDRFIFHVSFCGSTLLARMLELPGSSFALKEPNVLVDMADWKRIAGTGGAWRPALDLARRCLRRRWSPEEAVVAKPSNWANNLLPELVEAPRAIRPLFVTMEGRAFLTAVLRGGRDRLAFTARAAAHLASGVEAGEETLRAAIGASSDPLGRAVHLAAAALHLQLALFAQALRHGGWDGRQLIDAATITGSPEVAAARASEALALDIDPALLAASAARRAGENSKVPGAAFSPEQRKAEDGAVEAHHGRLIDQALGWAERTFGPDPLSPWR